MGNHFFIRNYKKGGDGADFWLGGAAISNPKRLPSCWDELIDWTEDASQIMEVFLRILNKHKRLKLPQEDGNKNKNENAWGVLSQLEQSQHQEIAIRFVPHVLLNESVKDLPYMTWIERAKFYAENVVIRIEYAWSEKINERVTTVDTFKDLYILLLRWVDLHVAQLCHTSTPPPPIESSASSSSSSLPTPPSPSSPFTMKNNQNKKEEQTIHNECIICLDDKKTCDMVVLPCSHSLCSKCTKRWVDKRLQCPFCRMSFGKKKSATASQWQVMEWDETIAEKDLNELEHLIMNCWDSMLQTQNGESNDDATKNASELLRAYIYHDRFVENQDLGDEILVGTKK